MNDSYDTQIRSKVQFLLCLWLLNHVVVTPFSSTTRLLVSMVHKNSQERSAHVLLLAAAGQSEQENAPDLTRIPRRSFVSTIATVLAFRPLAKDAKASNDPATAMVAPPAAPILSDGGIFVTPTVDMKFNTANDIPEDFFVNQRSIYGFVERVIDGDTMRVRHVPGYGITASAPAQPLKGGIANVTLSIRVYGVDTPETGKNKRQVSMPYGDEAKQFTTDLVHHKMVKLTLLRRDQYNRAVACVETLPDGLTFQSPRDLSLALAEAGLAELYTGGGAVYYNRRFELERAVAAAQRNQRGIWSLESRQSVADFKRQQKAQPISWTTSPLGSVVASCKSPI